MLAQEKKHLTELLSKIPAKRHRKVVTRGKGARTSVGPTAEDDVLELRIVGDVELIHRLEHIAIELGARTVEELEVPTVSVGEAELEFADNPIGTILQGARFREGMTQVELSGKSGIPQRHISEMENGKRPIGKVNARKLANALDVDYRIFL